jgi:hypothetical protein
MRASADEVVLALDAVVRSPESVRQVNDALRRTAEALDNSDQPMAWETIPLNVLGDLPSSVLSCWVFMLRASRNTGAERHPNSHQRSLSLIGEGHVQLREQRGWQSFTLSSDLAASLDSRWVTIPPNTWHRWLVGPWDWGVLSFHTAAADELIEERPLTPGDLDVGPTGQRRYQDKSE